MAGGNTRLEEKKVQFYEESSYYGDAKWSKTIMQPRQFPLDESTIGVLPLTRNDFTNCESL